MTSFSGVSKTLNLLKFIRKTKFMFIAPTGLWMQQKLFVMEFCDHWVKRCSLRTKTDNRWHIKIFTCTCNQQWGFLGGYFFFLHGNRVTDILEQKEKKLQKKVYTFITIFVTHHTICNTKQILADLLPHI